MATGRLRILVGVDFSKESLAALRAARSLVRRSDGELTIAHVRPSSDVRAAVLEEQGDLLRLTPGSLARSVSAYYDGRLAKLSTVAGEKVRLLSGEPARELCREAARGYDLLALGSRGRGAAATFLLGSTVQEVLARSSVPLLVVPAR